MEEITNVSKILNGNYCMLLSNVLRKGRRKKDIKASINVINILLLQDPSP